MHTNCQHPVALRYKCVLSSLIFGVQALCLAPLGYSVPVDVVPQTQNIETNEPPEAASSSGQFLGNTQEQPAPSTVPFFGNSQYQPASPSGGYGAQPAAPLAGTSQLAGAPPPTRGVPLHTAGLVHWGFLRVYPHVTYDVSYGNSLQSAPGQSANTVINQVSPGVLLMLGDHWSLDYTPTLRFYSNHQFKDGVDHAVSLSGTTSYESWVFGVSQAYSSTSQPLIETASQLDQEIFTTGLNATHALGSKFSLDMSLNQNLRYVDQGQQLPFEPVTDSREWSTLESLHYQIVPRLIVGVGAGFTYNSLSFGPDMTSEQVQASVKWTVIDKLTLQASGGADYRQFLDSSEPNLLSPIFSLAAVYHLFENTSLSLSGGNSLTPSYYQNSLSEVTSLTAGLHQRLFEKLWLDVTGGYTKTSYKQTAGVAVVAPDYDMTSVNVRLSTVLLRRVSAGIYWQENFVSSGSQSVNSNLYNYSTWQAGLSLGYHW